MSTPTVTDRRRPPRPGAVLDGARAAERAVTATRERLHAYPQDLGRLVRESLRERLLRGDFAGPLPPRAALEDLLSVAYQASLMRDERRAVTFRLAIASPLRFPEGVGPPMASHRLLFSRPRPLDAHELRRLAPATDFARSLIGVRLSARGNQAWGLLHAGPHCSAGTLPGARRRPLLVVSACGPGHVLATLDGVPLAELARGRLDTSDVDVFEAPWMPAAFGALQVAVAQAHVPTAHSAVDFTTRLATDVLRRALGIMRAEQHGGMLVVLPSTPMEALRGHGALRLKYDFVADRSRHRLQDVAIDTWRDVHAMAGCDEATPWQVFLKHRASQLRDADTALREIAHMIASLSQVDGAVLLTDALDIVGFGAEIGGHMPGPRRVAHARDLAGTSRTWLRADHVGTRHRAAYRLCQSEQHAMVLVVSQDGGLRVIRWHEQAVAYWAQVAQGPWDE